MAGLWACAMSKKIDIFISGKGENKEFEISEEGLRELASHDPTIHQCLRMFELQEWTFEKALMTCVFYLAQSNCAREEMILSHGRICTRL